MIKNLKPYLEISIDKMLDEGFVKEVPLIDTIVKIKNIPQTISDKILCDKINRFLQSFENVPEQERIDFFKKLNAEPKAKQKASTYILELLESLNESYKVDMIIKVFKAYLEGNIDYSLLYKLNKVISSLYSVHIEDIYKLKNIKNEEQIGRNVLSDPDLLNEFVNVNLLRIESNMDGNIYHITNVGKKFIELNLGNT